MARRIMGFSPTRGGQGQQYPPMASQRSLYNLSFEDVQRQLLLGNTSGHVVQEPSCDHDSFTKSNGIGEAWRGIVDHDHILNEPTLGESTIEHFLANAGVINVADQNANVHIPTPMVIDSIHHQQHWLQIPSVNVNTHRPQDFSVSNNSFYDSQLSYSENSVGIPMSPSYSDSSKTSLFRKRKNSNDDTLEKAVERRQKRMAKNRESAARSRAKKQVSLDSLLVFPVSSNYVSLLYHH
ncbi:ABSCISIC ACID-INSENSITIVE 5-like protein 2 [Vigna unguiculata]|uniref:ABA responsive element binding factor n=1 Tax=Vigna unguiculata TaxID=3917 RepID=A0A4D6MKW6_VIGUN|nr:ABSCISIC ACID-INSENSITIVE 5-like protein 2 [Vigna unguiculata]QCE00405.1 ABA responsive element binding factor [Vigna unguiculata]